HQTPSARRSLMRDGRLPDCLLARRVRGNADIEYQQANRAHKPRLPHAPGKGGYAKKRREARGGEGLDILGQALHAQRNGRAGQRQQEGADDSKLVPGLQENIVRVLAGRARKNKALRLIGLSLSVQAVRRADANAEPRWLENVLGGVLPQNDAGPRGIRKPWDHVPAGVIGRGSDRQDQREGEAPKSGESPDDGGAPFPRQQKGGER